MSDLREMVLEAHGGLERWREFKQVSAHLVQGGALWALKGRAGVLDDVSVTVRLDRQWASHAPFGDSSLRSAFDGKRIAIETEPGEVSDEMFDPRSSFAGHTLTTPWTHLQLAFFAGCAMWTYLNVPFVLAWPGVTSSELEPWEENGEVWRRLSVHYPDVLEVFSKQQTMYFGSDGLLRRMDYDVEIAGGTPGAHYVSDYVEVSGIMFPTKRRIYPRQPDGHSVAEPLVVSIDLDHIELTK
jgi:hypothetical protein